ncbi:serine/threonine protein kinase [Streptomyces sp. NBC_00249]|uniref:serine/threonine-protein kinase n=1 Tax=Streptomyces sp. NBC_00249 TaxID=2975690 RepID=UPI00224C93AE|nr:serine/threonine-protein kinase [Streptomyces sp. NBC_00249]MCX5196012.1 serine/threonine protein kinase [Streptomyces sp. NBC_00249]
MEQLHPTDPPHIGPYRLLSRLGAGGMGQVYLARSDRGRTVAVKLVHPALALREEFRERFRREVAAARRVGGTWTAPVLDADTEAEVPWFATGHIPGPSLRQAVDHDFGPLPARTVRILAAGLAYALQDIHRAGLIHRDLKPSNILLTLDGPRVIDFGIARPLQEADRGLTRPGELVGSPGFMAPEQVRGDPVTPACDVFCLGAVLAYAATGRLPFGDAEQPGGAAGLLLRIVEAEPDLGGVPAELRELVADCLRKDPAARPGSDAVLARVGADGTVADGRALEPWLPARLVAQLGRRAAELLDREDAGPDRAPHPPPPPPRTPPPPAPVPTYVYGPAPAAEPPPPRPHAASTAFLVAVAAVVATAAGGTVYAVMSAGPVPLPPTPHSPPVPASSPAEPPGTSRGTGPGTGPAAGPSTGTSGASPGTSPGVLPESYAGNWRATSGSATWYLSLTPGAVGEPVMTLRVEDPGYSCAWRAPLRSAPDPVELGASSLTSGTPPTCTAGSWSRLRLLPDGSLRRELDGGSGLPLTYHRE